jgi:mannose/fructose/N-acetylgalactosamine-specific phosphotransferase system component IID
MYKESFAVYEVKHIITPTGYMYTILPALRRILGQDNKLGILAIVYHYSGA